METLKDEIVRRKTDVFIYKLIKRNKFVAMYAQWYTDCDKPHIVAYEVFKVKLQKEAVRKIGGTMVKFAAKEKFPTDEDFGFSAWSIVDVKRADARFSELTRKAHYAHKAMMN